MFKKSRPHIESKNDKTDSVIYFNGNIRNPYVDAGQQKAFLAKFDQSLANGAVVDLPENYYLSIVRFSISHAAIPIYFFRDNFYSVTINNTQVFLTYIQSGNGYNAYGFTGLQPVYYYQQITKMVNIALKAAHDAEFGVEPNQEPFMTYDPVTEKFAMSIPSAYVNTGAYPYVFNVGRGISFNSNLFQQFQYFSATNNGLNQLLGKDYTLDLPTYSHFTNFVQYANPAAALPIPPAGLVPAYNYFRIIQERSALYLFNEIQSIVFSSSSLPTTKEFIGKNDGSGNAGSVPILVDFVPDQSAPRDLSQYQYVPNGPYKLINLTNSIPITSFDYQIGLATRSDVIYPLYLEPGEVCQVKFAFIKKSLFDNNFEY